MPALSALKELDQAGYLASLFVPEEKREAFAALQSYAAELRRVVRLASEPLPGEIRLQWWREVISGQRGGEAIHQPVASGLLEAIKAYRLPLDPLDIMAEARIFDLYNDPMPDLAALETYLGETEAVLIQFSGLMLDPTHAAKAAEAAGHAGMAIGIATILRHLPRHIARQRMFIPVSILNAIGATADQIFANNDDARGRALTAMVALGRDHLNSFNRLGHTVTPQLRPAFLGAALCAPVFRKAEKLGGQAFTSEILLPPIFIAIRLAYRAMRGW